MKKIIFRLLKYSAFFAVFLFVVTTALTKMGGNSDVLKGAIEDFLTENTSYKAQVGKLNAMNFFPDMVMDFEDLQMTAPGGVTPAITAKSVKIVIPFTDIMFQAQKYKALDIENIHLEPGVIFARGLDLAFIKIAQDNTTPRLMLKGKLGAAEISAQADMQASGQGAGQKFAFGPQWAFTSTLGALTHSGTVKLDPKGDLRIEDFKGTMDGQTALSGDLEINRIGGGVFEVGGALTLAGGAARPTVLRPDVRLTFGKGPLQVTGALEARPLALEDLQAQTPFAQWLWAILSVPEQPGAAQTPRRALDISGLDFEVDVKAAPIIKAQADWGEAAARLRLKESRFELAEGRGKIWDGDLTGGLTLETGKTPVKFTARLDLRTLQNAAYFKTYGLSDPISGTSDLTVNLEGTAPRFDDLAGRLGGQITLVGGHATLPAGAFDVWGQGLGQAIFSKKSAPEITASCTVADWELKDQKMTLKSFMIKGDPLNIQGAGQYDTAANRLDIVLYPRAKGGAAVSAVHVNGPLAAAKIKSGGAESGRSGLSGTDASLSLSLRNITLPADHPCNAETIQTEILAPPPAQGAAAP